jgi:uncharacterized protein (TIGR02466 family)
LSDQLIRIYPTTLLSRHVAGMEDTNRQLAALLAQMEREGENNATGTSTKGGFQTLENLLAGDHHHANHPALLTLKVHIAQAINDYVGLLVEQECNKPPARVMFQTWGWGVILRAGNWQGHHVHPNANISGVYYISAPPVTLDNDREEGKISFYDPRPRANMNQLLNQYTRHFLAPVPGDIVVFPSWLEHSVAPFQGEGERICIAFNAKLELSMI